MGWSHVRLSRRPGLRAATLPVPSQVFRRFAAPARAVGGVGGLGEGGGKADTDVQDRHGPGAADVSSRLWVTVCIPRA